MPEEAVKAAKSGRVSGQERRRVVGGGRSECEGEEG